MVMLTAEYWSLFSSQESLGGIRSSLPRMEGEIGEGSTRQTPTLNARPSVGTPGTQQIGKVDLSHPSILVRTYKTAYPVHHRIL